MLKRTLIIVSLTLVLIIGIEPTRSVHGILMTAAEVEMLNSSPDTTEADAQAKKDNAFVRAVKAPFKAIGRIFGFGKKDDNKLHRLSEKDVKKFEAARVLRVVDARSPAPEAAAADAASATANQPPGNEVSSADANLAQARQHLERGRALLKSGQADEAIKTLSLAVTLDPNLKEAHNLLGVAFESKGLRELAFKSFAVALRGDNDDPEHLNNLGYLYFKNGDYNDAAKYLKRAVKLRPTEQRYWNNLGLIQAQRGKFDEAYKCFARAVGEFEGHMNVARRLQAQGYDKEAIKHLEQARALGANTEILARLIQLYDRGGKTDKARETRSSLEELQKLASAPNQ